MKNRIVVLKTFLGTSKPKKDTLERENYWKLIGKKGKVVDENQTNDRVLVLFESNLDDYQLENHNPIKNSLWIKTTDLEFENE
jgi:hypothetical protein